MNNYNELIELLKEAILNEVYDKDSNLFTEITSDTLKSVGGGLGFMPFKIDDNGHKLTYSELCDYLSNNMLTNNEQEVYTGYSAEDAPTIYGEKIYLILGQNKHSHPKKFFAFNDKDFGLKHMYFDHLKDFQYRFTDIPEVLNGYKEALSSKTYRSFYEPTVAVNFHNNIKYVTALPNRMYSIKTFLRTPLFKKEYRDADKPYLLTAFPYSFDYRNHGVDKMLRSSDALEKRFLSDVHLFVEDCAINDSEFFPGYMYNKIGVGLYQYIESHLGYCTDIPSCVKLYEMYKNERRKDQGWFKGNS